MFCFCRTPRLCAVFVPFLVMNLGSVSCCLHLRIYVTPDPWPYDFERVQRAVLLLLLLSTAVFVCAADVGMLAFFVFVFFAFAVVLYFLLYDACKVRTVHIHTSIHACCFLWHTLLCDRAVSSLL